MTKCQTVVLTPAQRLAGVQPEFHAKKRMGKQIVYVAHADSYFLLHEISWGLVAKLRPKNIVEFGVKDAKQRALGRTKGPRKQLTCWGCSDGGEECWIGI